MQNKKNFNFNPIDQMVIINASQAKRKLILSNPSCCQAYLDCMELLPEAREVLEMLRKKKDEVEVFLSTPYHTGSVKFIADKFSIPYNSIYRIR